MSSQLTQRIFGRGVFEAPSAARGIRGKNIAAIEPELICRNRRLLILFAELIINATSTHQGIQKGFVTTFNIKTYTRCKKFVNRILPKFFHYNP
jgi:hypothetical protein